MSSITTQLLSPDFHIEEGAWTSSVLRVTNDTAEDVRVEAEPSSTDFVAAVMMEKAFVVPAGEEVDLIIELTNTAGPGVAALTVDVAIHQHAYEEEAYGESHYGSLLEERTLNQYFYVVEEQLLTLAPVEVHITPEDMAIEVTNAYYLKDAATGPLTHDVPIDADLLVNIQDMNENHLLLNTLEVRLNGDAAILGGDIQTARYTGEASVVLDSLSFTLKPIQDLVYGGRYTLSISVRNIHDQEFTTDITFFAAHEDTCYVKDNVIPAYEEGLTQPLQLQNCEKWRLLVLPTVSTGTAYEQVRRLTQLIRKTPYNAVLETLFDDVDMEKVDQSEICTAVAFETVLAKLRQRSTVFYNSLTELEASDRVASSLLAHLREAVTSGDPYHEVGAYLLIPVLAWTAQR